MRRILPLTALLLLAWCAAAQAEPKHFLWRVSKGGQTLYLTGSVHVLRPADYPLPAVLEDAFKSSAGLVEEIDLAHFDAESAQLQMIKQGSYPPGQSLKTDLPPAVYAQVVELTKRQKVDLAMIEPMRPWLASIVLLDNQLEQEGFDPESGVDIHFADEAEAAMKPVIGLEEPQFQLGLLAELPDKDQQDLLVQSLDESKTLKAEMDGLIRAWHDGDTGTLEKELKEEFGGYPEVYRAVLVQRNEAWMPRLEELLASGKQYFVVVGALHLVGPDGLLAHFRKDGYQVEQL
ncbi:MAG TPA: TraB/GumN family protein [Gammaproteobacteria bacterium]|nr:TraB/GumN family protein [Gammaproteobacteria bacterium]